MTTGLDDVVAAETTLSHVDGTNGRLILRGYDLEALAGHIGFEAVIALLWDGMVDHPIDEALVRRALGRARSDAFALLSRILAGDKAPDPVTGLRLGLAMLPDDGTAGDPFAATAAAPVIVAGVMRARMGLNPIAPDPTSGHAADFLRMLRGTPARETEIAALDAYLTTVSDHGLNASTFTARVIASTRAGMVSSVIGALCALKGPLHGGAPGPVLDMLDEIGTPDAIESWIDARLAAGERLMGFGHRIYRVRDPRADVLKGVVATLRGTENRIAFAQAVERVALDRLNRLRPHRRIDTNVEFYTALLLEALGLPRDAFTAVFAIGRIAGWSAHILEQERTGRLIRPQSRYIGPQARAA